MHVNLRFLAIFFCVVGMVNFPAWSMWEVSTLELSDKINARATHGTMVALGHLQTPTISFVDCQSHDDKRLAAVEMDLGGVRVLQSGVDGLAYSPDGTWLAATTLGQLHLILAQTISLPIDGEKAEIASTFVFDLPVDEFFSILAFSNDGNLLVAAGDMGQICAWRKQSNQSFQQIAAIKFATDLNDIHQIAFIDDRRIVITEKEQIAIWEWVGDALVVKQKLFGGENGIFLITPEGNIGIMRKEEPVGWFPSELVMYDTDKATGDVRISRKISFFNLFTKRLGTVSSCALDSTQNTFVFGLKNSFSALAQIEDSERECGVSLLRTFAFSGFPVRFVAFLTPHQLVALGERTLKVCSRNSSAQK